MVQAIIMDRQAQGDSAWNAEIIRRTPDMSERALSDAGRVTLRRERVLPSQRQSGRKVMHATYSLWIDKHKVVQPRKRRQYVGRLISRSVRFRVH